MYMRDGLLQSGMDATMFAAVDSGMGSITNIFGSIHYLNYQRRGELRGASNMTRGH